MLRSPKHPFHFILLRDTSSVINDRKSVFIQSKYALYDVLYDRLQPDGYRVSYIDRRFFHDGAVMSGHLIASLDFSNQIAILNFPMCT